MTARTKHGAIGERVTRAPRSPPRLGGKRKKNIAPVLQAIYPYFIRTSLPPLVYQFIIGVNAPSHERPLNECLGCLLKYQNCIFSMDYPVSEGNIEKIFLLWLL